VHDFQSKWIKLSADYAKDSPTKPTKPGFVSSVSGIQGEEGTKISDASLAVPQVLSRLQAGSRWLGDQHQKYLADDPTAVSDTQFSAAIAGWDLMERELRATGYADCVMGTGERCPTHTPVVCDACAVLPKASHAVPAAIGGIQGKLLS
jgi:hypothetical protein